MKRNHEKVAPTKTIYARLLCGALVLVAVLTIFAVGANFAFFCAERTRMLAATSGEFGDAVELLDRYFDQMKYTFAEISMNSTMYPITNGKITNNYDYRNVIYKLRESVFVRRQNEFSEFLEAVFIITPSRNKTIIDSNGTYPREQFFSLYYNNPVYTDQFWVNEMQKDVVFRACPVGQFSNIQDTTLVTKRIMPIIYKLPSNNNFIIVSLLDVDSILNNCSDLAGKKLFIYNEKGELVYPETPMFSLDEVKFEDNELAVPVKGGYVFRRMTDTNGLTYYCYVEDHTIFSNINQMQLWFYIICLLVLGVCILLAIRFARAFQRPLEKIAKRLCEQGCYAESLEKGVTMPSLYGAVDTLVNKNSETITEIHQKDHQLKEIYLQSRMRDIYVSIDDVEHKLDLSLCYLMIYIHVNFEDQFQRNLEEMGKTTFFLKQLIELYLSEEPVSSVSFQVESDQIVSVFNVPPEFDGINRILDNLLRKLENESEYAFFTVVVSRLHEDPSQIKQVYDRLCSTAKYAMPVAKTQVLFEDEVKLGVGRFYFTIEQMEKLSAMLQNDPAEDCKQYFEEVLDYNIKKEVNGFDLYLLCTEVVNCVVKLVNRLFYVTPEELEITKVYARLDRAVSLPQYQNICNDLIMRAVSHIRVNKREEDYIISFVLDYVEKHYAEDIYLNLFAEKLKLTAAYISSYFKEKMNVNLSDYINNYRIKKAIVLMENPQNKNKDIAAMVGLPNINTFIRLFKKHTGYTPGDYKKKHFSE